MEDVISRQAAIGIIQNWLNIEGYSCGERNVMKCAIEELKDLPSVSTEKSLDKAKSEIRCGENKAYNADFTMGCEYAISVIERMFEEVEE